MPQSEKTRELILYVTEKLKDEPTYGATLLNKALYFIDNISYLNSGKPISELRYIKQEHGPTPRPKDFLPLREDMVAEGELREEKMDFFGRVQKKYIPQRTSNTEFFSKEEVMLIDNVLSKICKANATDISEFTHTFLAWQLAEHMEELPYFTFLLTSTEPAPADIEWANTQIASLEHV